VVSPGRGRADDDRTGDRPGEGPSNRAGDDHTDDGPDDGPGADRAGDVADDDRSRGRVEPGAGTDPICRVAIWATGVFVVASALAAAWPDTFLPLSVPVDLVLFAAGCGAFLWAYALAIGRSRYETITMSGLFFVGEGVAPPDVTRLLRGAFGMQVVVAVTAAAVRPFTALAFSVLVPMLGLGLMALWAARHGRFPAKPSERDE
jgi:hypothetical protein